MAEVQLFAVTKTGVRPLEIPPDATSFDDLYDGLPLGIYSALRTFSHHKFLYLEAHLARARRSMALLGWDYQLDEMTLRRGLHQVCSQYPLPDARVRFDVLAEPIHISGCDSRVLIALMPFTPLPAQMYEEGVSVKFAPDLSRKQPLAKKATFAIRRRDYARERAGNMPYEFLMLDDAGFVLEGTGSNFYGVRDGILYTAGKGVLEGVSRQIILHLLPEVGIPFQLKPVHMDEIVTLDEAALSSSSRALLPIVHLNGQRIGDGRPGPVCRHILKAYNQFVAEQIKPAIEE